MFPGKTLLLPCDDPEWSNLTKYFALHFADFGLKKLISTSYAHDDNSPSGYEPPNLFDDHDKTDDVAEAVQRLLNDPAVRRKRGIYAYVRGGQTEPHLLNVRIFEEGVKRAAYAHQTTAAQVKSVSNCSA